MACFRPMAAYVSRSGEVRLGTPPGDCRLMELPCGRCVGCKLDRARGWTDRIMHEASLYDWNLCVTLTYSDEALPPSLSLEYPHFQAFLKRLRKRLSGDVEAPDGRKPIRFFVAGEYGERGGRPHWHVILFNTRAPDLVQLYNAKYQSAFLEDVWQQQGNVVVDRLNSAAAAYVAGYTLKKAKAAAYAESTVDPRTGEVFDRRPPFVVMSRRPGIGAWWYERYGRDCLPGDFVVASKGQRHKVPRFYFEKFRRVADPATVEEVLYGRYLRAMQGRAESTPERRAVREEEALRRQAFFDSSSL